MKPTLATTFLALLAVATFALFSVATSPGRTPGCDADPCLTGVTCINTNDGFQCGECPEGFEGNGVNCTLSGEKCGVGFVLLDGGACADLP